MEWKIFLTVFGTVFLAELGDKTQLATMAFSAQSKSPVSVFIASALALVLSSLLAVVAGKFIQRYVPENVIGSLAGGAFIIIGALILFKTLKS